jgi:hypothetical protein
MSRRKKLFACGHKGYGQTCHRCANVTVAAPQEQAGRNSVLPQDKALEEKRLQKQEWESTFATDPIDLTDLPAHVVLKARTIIAGLESQKNYRDFGGKRLRHNRWVISIPVTRNYRMICHDHGSLLVPQAVLSHEDYNVDKPGG